MERCLSGADARHFLLESHARFMRDIGKRSFVISRLNQDLDCVDIRDLNDPNQISNAAKLIELYKELCQ